MPVHLSNVILKHSFSAPYNAVTVPEILRSLCLFGRLPAHSFSLRFSRQQSRVALANILFNHRGLGRARQDFNQRISRRPAHQYAKRQPGPELLRKRSFNHYNLRWILLPIFALALFSEARSNTVPNESPVVDLSIFFSADSANFKTLILPIRRVQNLIVVEARINDVVGNFILDTGCPLLVLNKTYFRKGYEIRDRVEANAANGQAGPVMRSGTNNLQIRELYFEKIAADLSDLGHIENQRDIKILGLLGVGLFTSFEVVIDLHKSVIYLHKVDETGNVPPSEKVIHTQEILNVPFSLIRNIITVEATIAGKTMTFCVDTGAESNAISNLVSSKILSTFNVSKRMLMLGTGGSRKEVLLGTLDEFILGQKVFKNMHAIISPLEDLGNAYGRSIDGILGNNFLVKGIISINFVKKELRMYNFDVDKPKDKE